MSNDQLHAIIYLRHHPRRRHLRHLRHFRYSRYPIPHQAILMLSTHPLIKTISELSQKANQPAVDTPETPGGPRMRGRTASGENAGRPAPKAPTIYSRFSASLEELMSELRRSDVHFVRCLKPNDKLKPRAANQVLLVE